MNAVLVWVLVIGTSGGPPVIYGDFNTVQDCVVLQNAKPFVAKFTQCVQIRKMK